MNCSDPSPVAGVTLSPFSDTFPPPTCYLIISRLCYSLGVGVEHILCDGSGTHEPLLEHTDTSSLCGSSPGTQLKLHDVSSFSRSVYYGGGGIPIIIVW